jgi:hypothetical protein
MFASQQPIGRHIFGKIIWFPDICRSLGKEQKLIQQNLLERKGSIFIKSSLVEGDGEVFYQGCMEIADMYGKDKDRANIHIAVGNFYTNIKVNYISQFTFGDKSVYQYNGL